MATARKTAKTKQSTVQKANPNRLIRKAREQFQKHQIIYSVLFTLVGLAILIVGLFFLRKDFFIVGSINGELVTTPQFYSRMLAENGEATFESMVRDTLIKQEAKKQKITVSEAEIDEKIKEIENRFGGSVGLQQALATNNATMEQLREQIKNQITVEKLLAEKIKVSDKEAEDYIKQNKQATEGLKKEEVLQMLRSNKLNEEFDKWFGEIRKNASIQNYFKKQ